MRNPTKAEVQIVIDNLKKVLPAAKQVLKSNDSDVNMLYPHISFCGTPMCHAGWYALATWKENERKSLHYDSGAQLMAKHLGFDSEFLLADWALSNAELWGNRNGSLMFGSMFAFNYTGILTLAKIIKHWKKVQKRLPE